jgi:hypothetical protein
MKKIFFSFICLLAVAAIVLVSCNKSDGNKSTNPVTCSDSAYLLPDSLIACAPGNAYKLFYVLKNKKDILVPVGVDSDIDVIVNGATYLINYDSVGTVPVCGALLTKANLTCHTKL